MSRRCVVYASLLLLLLSAAACVGDRLAGSSEMRLLACDNPRTPARYKCNPEYHGPPMTIALYDRPNGSVIAHLQDRGDGVLFRFLSTQNEWWKVEILESSEIGFVYTREPFGAIGRTQQETH